MEIKLAKQIYRNGLTRTKTTAGESQRRADLFAKTSQNTIVEEFFLRLSLGQTADQTLRNLEKLLGCKGAVAWTH